MVYPSLPTYGVKDVVACALVVLLDAGEVMVDSVDVDVLEEEVEVVDD